MTEATQQVGSRPNKAVRGIGGREDHDCQGNEEEGEEGEEELGEDAAVAAMAASAALPSEIADPTRDAAAEEARNGPSTSGTAAPHLSSSSPSSPFVARAAVASSSSLRPSSSPLPSSASSSRPSSSPSSSSPAQPSSPLLGSLPFSRQHLRLQKQSSKSSSPNRTAADNVDPHIVDSRRSSNSQLVSSSRFPPSHSTSASPTPPSASTSRGATPTPSIFQGTIPASSSLPRYSTIDAQRAAHRLKQPTHRSAENVSSSAIDEPDDYSPEEDYKRAIQRQERNRLRLTKTGPGSSAGGGGVDTASAVTSALLPSTLLSKLKNHFAKPPSTSSSPSAGVGSRSSQYTPTSSTSSRAVTDFSSTSPTTRSFERRPGSALSSASGLGYDGDQTIQPDSPLPSSATAAVPSYIANPTFPPISHYTGALSNGSQPRQSDYMTDLSDASQHVWVWRHESSSKPSSSSSSAPFSKSQLLREVPQVTRKLTKRESGAPFRTHPSASPSSLGSDSSKIHSFAHNWLREKPSKSKLSPTTPPAHLPGGWREGIVSMKENGHFYVYGEDRALWHPIAASDLKTTDIRPVDKSVFGRVHVVGIFAQPSALNRTRDGAAFSSVMQDFPVPPGEGSSSSTKAEPIYIAFATAQKARLWMALLRTWARPQIYGRASTQPTGGRYRWHREINMSVCQFRCKPKETRVNARNNSIVPNMESPSGGAVFPLSPSMEPQSTGLVTAARNEDDVMLSSPSLAARSLPSSSGHNAAPAAAVLPTAAAGSAPLQRTATESSTVSGSSELSDDSDSETASTIEYMSGPIAGGTTLTSPTLSASVSTSALSIGSVMRSRQSHYHQESGSGAGPAPLQASSLSCQIVLDDDVAGRTKVKTTKDSASHSVFWWSERFSFLDLPAPRALRVDLISHSTSSKHQHAVDGPVLRGGVCVGSAEIPIESLRVGEEISGNFPVWSARVPARDVGAGPAPSKYQAICSLAAECIGEIELSITVTELPVLASAKYNQLLKMLTDSTHGNELSLGPLARALEKHKIIEHLVDIHAGAGVAASEIQKLVHYESDSFRHLAAPLLFRDNTTLSRALDRLQRVYCFDWLEASIGETIRRICRERTFIDIDTHKRMDPGTSMTMGSADGYGSSAGISSSGLTGSPALADDSEANGPYEKLRVLAVEMWDSIYANRHKCPNDLRMALGEVRKVVNVHFTERGTTGTTSNQTTSVGMQGVSAFVFLRLLCPAIRSPGLYGLVPYEPEPDDGSAQTLKLLAQIFITLGNRRGALLPKDMESWMRHLSGFFQQYGSACEDFITVVSTPDQSVAGDKKKNKKANKRTDSAGEVAAASVDHTGTAPSSVVLLDEEDRLVQRIIDLRLPLLPPLQAQAIGSAPAHLDLPKALAGLVSYVCREADTDLYDAFDDVDERGEEEAVDVTTDAPGQAVEDPSTTSASNSLDLTRLSSSSSSSAHSVLQASSPTRHRRDSRGSASSLTPLARRKVRNFIWYCCELGKAAGEYIDAAGFCPRPLRFPTPSSTPYHVAQVSSIVGSVGGNRSVVSSAVGPTDSHASHGLFALKPASASVVGGGRAVMASAALALSSVVHSNKDKDKDKNTHHSPSLSSYHHGSSNHAKSYSAPPPASIIVQGSGSPVGPSSPVSLATAASPARRSVSQAALNSSSAASSATTVPPMPQRISVPGRTIIPAGPQTPSSYDGEVEVGDKAGEDEEDLSHLESGVSEDEAVSEALANSGAHQQGLGLRESRVGAAAEHSADDDADEMSQGSAPGRADPHTHRPRPQTQTQIRPATAVLPLSAPAPAPATPTKSRPLSGTAPALSGTMFSNVTPSSGSDPARSSLRSSKPTRPDRSPERKARSTNVNVQSCEATVDASAGAGAGAGAGAEASIESNMEVFGAGPKHQGHERKASLAGMPITSSLHPQAQAQMHEEACHSGSVSGGGGVGGIGHGDVNGNGNGSGTKYVETGPREKEKEKEKDKKKWWQSINVLSTTKRRS